MIDISTLNEAQREAVTAGDGPMLVIAGAGSGKTRTIVYRLAWLAGQGVDPFSMLLLTFTRKSSQEMLNRASRLLDGQLLGVQGGTFHSYAFSVLRRFPPSWMKGSLSIMDTGDSTEAVSSCKDALKLGKGDRSFPKTQAILGLFSKARNKEIDLGDLLSKEAQHLLPHAEGLLELNEAYSKYKREHSLLDYDDLLFEVERLFLESPEVLEAQRMRFRRIMVDEYQDTNKVQARIVRLLAGSGGNIMAVGDDAQSIYAFRGATVHNILEFPDLFPGTRIIRLEENYRSVQPVLDVANSLLENTTEGYRKHLFSRRPVSDGRAVTLYRPLSDITQAQLAARRIEELLATVPYGEIAVLFRSGYQSYHLEVELNRRGIRFRKYGGLRYSEAAHIKDVMAFARLVGNPLDLPSFDRIAALSKGIGPKTSRKLFDLAAAGDGPALEKACRRWPEFLEHLGLVSALRMENAPPVETVGRILEAYRPKLQEMFPEDWPRREQGLEELSSMAAQYEDLQTFIADLSLESPEDSGEEEEEPRITLSTVHSAKGLEWSAVLLIDLVEDRFPSRHALVRPEDFEEERRLMYVACTRAKDTLDLFSPLSLYSRSSGGQEPATPSPFIRELPYGMLDEIYENYGGGTARRRTDSGPSYGSGRSLGGSRMPVPDDPFRGSGESWPPRGEEGLPGGRSRREADEAYADAVRSVLGRDASGGDPFAGKTPRKKLGFCRHRLFGRGKIVEEIEPGKYRINFPGFGLKVILAAYVTLED